MEVPISSRLLDCLNWINITGYPPPRCLKVIREVVKVQFPHFQWKRMMSEQTYREKLKYPQLGHGEVHRDSTVAFYLFCFHVSNIQRYHDYPKKELLTERYFPVSSRGEHTIVLHNIPAQDAGLWFMARDIAARCPITAIIREDSEQHRGQHPTTTGISAEQKLLRDRKLGRQSREFDELMRCRRANHVAVRNMTPYIPRMCIGRFSNNHLETLREMDMMVRSSKQKPQNCRQKKVETPGFNMGCTLPPGHKFIHSPSTFTRKLREREPELHRKYNQLLADMFHEAFGKQAWYKRLYKELEAVVVAVHGEKAVDHIFPVRGCPFTAIWISVHAKAVGLHTDDDSFGALFACTAQTYDGFVLEVRDEDGRILESVQPEAGQILGGSWGLYDHKVSKLPHARGQGRPSIVFYFDRRVLSSKYTLKVHN